MHFGLVKKINYFMSLLCLSCGILALSSCQDKIITSGIEFKLPEPGQRLSVGQDVKVELDIPKEGSVTSAIYLLDGKEVATKKSAEPVVIKTEGQAVGYKVITAIIESNNSVDTLTVNIELKSNIKPELYGYKVIKTYPHDTSAYTQGLEYHNGRMLESTGREGYSTLRWVDLASGKPVQKIDLDKQYFGEGSTLVGDKVIMLTYTNNLGMVYDAQTFKQLSTFVYSTSRQGWGLCFNGEHLIMSDGSNRLYFMNKETYKDERAIDVYDDQGMVDSINELEYIDGKLYANIYTKNYIVVIDPSSGIVEKKIDLSGLLEDGYFKDQYDISNNVLNGIAWDKQGKRLFVTGKKWPKLFEISLVAKE